MVAGNHDTPRSAETGCILRLFAPLGIHVVDARAARARVSGAAISRCSRSPDVSIARPKLVPDRHAPWNVLLLHGEVEGMLGPFAATHEIGDAGDPAGGAQRVALGLRRARPLSRVSADRAEPVLQRLARLHEHEQLGRAHRGARWRACRARGSSSTISPRGTHTFHPLPPSREFVDLPPISARGLTRRRSTRAFAAAVEACPGGIDDKIVRLVVRDVPRHIARELDHKPLREYKRRALHFHLDTRRPEIIRSVGHGAPGRRPSLADIVRDKLRERVLPSDIDRDALVTLGLRYLEEAEERDSPSASLPSVGG